MRPIDLLAALSDRAVQTALELDADTRAQLAALHGRVCCIRVTAPPVTLYLLPDETGLHVRSQYDGAVDVSLSGSVSAFARLAVQGRHSSVMTDGGVRVQGDAELGQQLQKILGQLDLDWEELLARVMGDLPARSAANLLRGVGGWVRQTAELERENLADYLREERKILATEVAMQRFEKSLSQLRAGVDRAARRLELLRKPDAD